MGNRTFSAPWTGQGNVTDYAGLIDALREAGAVVQSTQEVPRYWLSADCSRMSLNDAIVTVWEFDDHASAEAHATRVSRNGCGVKTDTALILFQPVGSAYWYKSVRLIVLYIGDNEAVTALLEAVLGPHFAPW